MGMLSRGDRIRERNVLEMLRELIHGHRRMDEGDYPRRHSEELIELVTMPCPVCGERDIIPATRAQQNRYFGGEPVQSVFPEIRPDQRERLLSGFCPDCWVKAFGEESC